MMHEYTPSDFFKSNQKMVWMWVKGTMQNICDNKDGFARLLVSDSIIYSFFSWTVVLENRLW